MVFQGSALFDSMSILENVMFPLRMFTNQNESEMQDRADAVLKPVSYTHLTLPTIYSV